MAAPSAGSLAWSEGATNAEQSTAKHTVLHEKTTVLALGLLSPILKILPFTLRLTQNPR